MFSKVARYEINIQKSIVFLHSRDEHTRNKIKKRILPAIPSKRIKYVGIHLTKKYKTYSENNKMLLKEIKEDLNKWKDMHFHQSEKLILLRC